MKPSAGNDGKTAGPRSSGTLPPKFASRRSPDTPGSELRRPKRAKGPATQAPVRPVILGSPEVLISTRTNLRFEHETVELPELAGLSILDLQPIEGSAASWLALTTTGSLIEIDLLHRSARTVAQVPHDALDFDGTSIHVPDSSWTHGPRCVLRVSRNGEVAAVANTYGPKGVVLDLSTGQVTMRLHRDEYHEDVSAFPLALSDLDGRLVVIHGTEWNRLDVSDARTGVLLTQRQPTSYKRGEARPPHYLDYFHCQLSVSPGQQYVADNGWVWHPIGVVTTWSLSRWLRENVWESEDGESQKSVCWRDYYWDGPMCWIDDHRLAVWGYGRDDQWLIPAVQIFDLVTGKQVRWFAGPKGALAFDGHLFSFDARHGTAVWDVETGERLVNDSDLCSAGYHRGAKHFVSLVGGGAVRVSRLVNE
jgi:hypothetical protein